MVTYSALWCGGWVRGRGESTPSAASMTHARPRLRVMVTMGTWAAATLLVMLVSAGTACGAGAPSTQGDALAAPRLRANQVQRGVATQSQAPMPFTPSGDVAPARVVRRAATTPPAYAPVVVHQDYAGEYQNGTVKYVTLTKAYNNVTRTVSGIRIKALWDAIGG